MQKSFGNPKINKRNFIVKKATALLLILAVVFVLALPARASAFSWGDLASGVGKSMFGGAKDYTAGKVWGWATGSLGNGAATVFQQAAILQGLYQPAMRDFITQTDKTWLPGLTGFFTASIFYPEATLGAFVGSGEQQSFQEAGDYTGIVRNAENVSGYIRNQSAAQSTYRDAQETIEETTNAGVSNLLNNNKTAQDVTASQKAYEGIVVSELEQIGQSSGGGGGGLWGLFKGIGSMISNVVVPGSGVLWGALP